jgi:hypothetical protein
MDNKDVNYKPTIDYSTNINQQPLMKETRVILSLIFSVIYRDSLYNKETKNETLSSDKFEVSKKEEKKIGMHDLEKIFLERKVQKQAAAENTNSPIVYKKAKWYEAILLKLLKIINNK